MGNRAPKVPPRRSSLTSTVKRGPGSSGSSLHSRTNTKGELQCFACRDWGHIAAFCPERKSSGVKATSRLAFFNLQVKEVDDRSATEMTHVKSGVLDGKPVTVFMDTGSHMSVVRAGLVDKPS